MVKKDFKLMGEKVTPSWNVNILARAFKEKELKSIWDAYKNARLTAGSAAKEPTELQKEIAAYARKTKWKRVAIAEKFKVKVHVVHSAIQKVAIYSYLND